MPVVTSKNKRERVVVHKSGHAATFRKVRCPRCSLGYAVQDNVDKTKFVCQRCGSAVQLQSL